MFGWAKWVCLVPAIAIALVGAIHLAVRAARAVWRAPPPTLWFQLLVVVVFVVAVAVPDQSADAVRRLSVLKWVVTILLVAVLMLVLLLSATRAIRPAGDEA